MKRQKACNVEPGKKTGPGQPIFGKILAEPPPNNAARACRVRTSPENAVVSIRATLLGIGILLWAGAWIGWLRYRAADRKRAWKQLALFVAMGLPFIVAGAFYTSSSYPDEVLPESAALPVAKETTPAPLALEAPPPAAPAASSPREHAAAVLAAQHAAVARYPGLGVADSPFNRAFLDAYRRIQRTEASYFDDPQWPLRLADEVAAALAPGTE